MSRILKRFFFFLATAKAAFFVVWFNMAVFFIVILFSFITGNPTSEKMLLLAVMAFIFSTMIFIMNRRLS